MLPLSEHQSARGGFYREARLCWVFSRLTDGVVRCPTPTASSISLSARLPEGSCRTITFDRGTEFAAYAFLGRAIGTQAYFCDPHSPWQKGAVENANGRIRRFLPGDRNLTELADYELQRVATMLNATPRRCLGYRTPNEAFQDQLAALPQAA